MFVYLNLTTKAWHARVKPKASRARLAGEIDGTTMALADVTFRASEAVAAWCRNRETETGKPWRLVHAFAAGDMVPVASVPHGEPVRISYNHRCGAYFYRCDTGARIEHCAYVMFAAGGRAYAFGDIR